MDGTPLAPTIVAEDGRYRWFPALGAVMLGYYVTYLAGVRWRLSRHAKT